MVREVAEPSPRDIQQEILSLCAKVAMKGTVDNCLYPWRSRLGAELDRRQPLIHARRY